MYTILMLAISHNAKKIQNYCQFLILCKYISKKFKYISDIKIYIQDITIYIKICYKGSLRNAYSLPITSFTTFSDRMAVVCLLPENSLSLRERHSLVAATVKAAQAPFFYWRDGVQPPWWPMRPIPMRRGPGKWAKSALEINRVMAAWRAHHVRTAQHIPAPIQAAPHDENGDDDAPPADPNDDDDNLSVIELARGPGSPDASLCLEISVIYSFGAEDKDDEKTWIDDSIASNRQQTEQTDMIRDLE